MPNVLVTGASSGIGRELARTFARRGHDLVVTARRVDRLRALAAELTDAHGVRVRVVPADLSADDAVEGLVASLEGTTVDVLVNNAGFGTTGAFHEIPPDDDLDQLRVNVMALTKLSKAWLPPMVRRGRGGILNVASTAAFQPGPRAAVYFASKAYVLRLSEALAEELSGTGVTVTALCPGPTPTEFGARAGVRGTRLARLTRGVATDAVTVAEGGVRAFERGQRVYVPGLVHRVGSLLPRIVPTRLLTRAIARAYVTDD